MKIETYVSISPLASVIMCINGHRSLHPNSITHNKTICQGNRLHYFCYIESAYPSTLFYFRVPFSRFSNNKGFKNRFSGCSRYIFQPRRFRYLYLGNVFDLSVINQFIRSTVFSLMLKIVFHVIFLIVFFLSVCSLPFFSPTTEPFTLKCVRSLQYDVGKKIKHFGRYQMDA